MANRSSFRTASLRGIGAVVGLGVLASVCAPAAAATAAVTLDGPLASYVVRADAAGLAAAEEFARDNNGRVVRSLSAMGMTTVEVPSGAVARLRALDGVAAVTPNVKVHLMGKSTTTTTTTGTTTYAPGTDANSLYNIGHSLGARQA